MQKSSRKKSLTGAVTAHVTPEEEKLFQDRAAQEGLTISEWSRRVLLGSLNASSDTRLVLSELLSIRRLFLTIHVDVLQGHDLTDERFKTLIDKAEKEKFAIADNRIQTYYSQPSGILIANEKESAA